jgi:hypothetical protein
MFAHDMTHRATTAACCLDINGRVRACLCSRVCVCVCVCVRVRGRSMATLLRHSGAHRRRTEVRQRPQQLLRPQLLPERSCPLHSMEAWAKHRARRQCATTMLSSIVARRVHFKVYLLRHNTRCANPKLASLHPLHGRSGGRAQRTLLLQKRSAVRLGGAAHSSCSPPVHCVVVESWQYCGQRRQPPRTAAPSHAMTSERSVSKRVCVRTVE